MLGITVTYLEQGTAMSQERHQCSTRSLAVVAGGDSNPKSLFSPVFSAKQCLKNLVRHTMNHELHFLCGAAWDLAGGQKVWAMEIRAESKGSAAQ